MGGYFVDKIIADPTIQGIVDMLYPQFKLADQEAIRVMYDLFEDAGTPLPKDSNLCDYGFIYRETIPIIEPKPIDNS